MKPNGKCIAKDCTKCNFFYGWDMTNKEGLRERKYRCIFSVLAEEIPRIRGNIDGVQQAANEARNRVNDLGNALAVAYENTKLLEKE